MMVVKPTHRADTQLSACLPDTGHLTPLMCLPACLAGPPRCPTRHGATSWCWVWSSPPGRWACSSSPPPSSAGRASPSTRHVTTTIISATAAAPLAEAGRSLTPLLPLPSFPSALPHAMQLASHLHHHHLPKRFLLRHPAPAHLPVQRALGHQRPRVSAGHHLPASFTPITLPLHHRLGPSVPPRVAACWR